MIIKNDEELAAAIEQAIAWEQQPNAVENKDLDALSNAIEAYEEANGHTPAPPQTPEGIAKVADFKRRTRGI